MACIASIKPAALVAPRSAAFSGARSQPAAFSKPTVGLKFAAERRPAQAQRRSATVTRAVGPMELAQIAGEGGFIGGVAGVMVGITLVGLAIGFVILRVESLAEEGKI